MKACFQSALSNPPLTLHTLPLFFLGHAHSCHCSFSPPSSQPLAFIFRFAGWPFIRPGYQLISKKKTDSLPSLSALIIRLISPERWEITIFLPRSHMPSHISDACDECASVRQLICNLSVLTAAPLNNVQARWGPRVSSGEISQGGGAWAWKGIRKWGESSESDMASNQSLNTPIHTPLTQQLCHGRRRKRRSRLGFWFLSITQIYEVILSSNDESHHDSHLVKCSCPLLSSCPLLAWPCCSLLIILQSQKHTHHTHTRGP